MSFQAGLAFAIAFFILVVTPGPAIAVIVSRTLSSGVATGFALTVGFILGDLIFLSIAILGLSKLATTLGPLFQVVKYAGAAYLVLMGFKALNSQPQAIAATPTRAQPLWREVLSGIVIILGNPKPIVFYSALLPSFFDLAHFGLSDFLGVFAIICAISLSVNGAYAILADRSRTLFASKRAVKRLNQATGCVLIGTGLVVAARS